MQIQFRFYYCCFTACTIVIQFYRSRTSCRVSVITEARTTDGYRRNIKWCSQWQPFLKASKTSYFLAKHLNGHPPIVSYYVGQLFPGQCLILGNCHASFRDQSVEVFIFSAQQIVLHLSIYFIRSCRSGLPQSIHLSIVGSRPFKSCYFCRINKPTRLSKDCWTQGWKSNVL